MKLKNKKLKYVFIAAGVLTISAILPVTLLTSCSSNGGRPFGPYTVLSINNENNLRYNTKSGTIEFYNSGNSLNGQYQNEWVDIKELKDYYLDISNKQVQNTLNNPEQLQALIDAHKQDGNSPSNIDNNSIKQNYQSAAFMLGVSINEQQQKVANMLNYMSILGSVFIAVDSFASNMINYVINSEFSQTYNNLVNGEKQLNTVFNLANEISANPDTKNQAQQFIVGQGMSFGSGSNTYHLWPSGFNANITSIADTNTINSPYPYYQEGGDNTVYVGQKTLNVSNITLNYQWYKAAKNGGDYVVANDVMANITSEQQEVLNKLGITTLDNGFQISINNLEFNLMPESYAYTDPLLSNLVDYVHTGLYNVMPQVQKQNVSENMDAAIPYPTYLEKNGVKWRVINSETKNNRYSETSLGASLYNEIQSKLAGASFNNDGIEKIPYYTLNNQWTSMGEDNSDENDYGYSSFSANSLGLGYKDINYISKIFVDPFYDEQGDRYVANNKNELPKANYINLWLLGALSRDLKSKDIEDRYNQLIKISSSSFLPTNNTNLDAFQPIFNSGLSTYYALVNFGTISKGQNIYFNNNNEVVKE